MERVGEALTPTPQGHALRVSHLGRGDYEPVWHRMQRFTEARSAQTPDELWLVEHPPVYTVGLNGRRQHILHTGAIPVVQVDRGGQVTYHGPGQVVAYTLLDLGRRGIGVRHLVATLEEVVIDLLADEGITARRRAGAPGVYVEDAKIAALGLRVRRGRCYHGLSLNVNMDLGPFRGIDPCGYPGLAVTQMADLVGPRDPDRIAAALADRLGQRLAAPGSH